MKPMMRIVLPAGDLLALFLFITIGQADHETLDLANQASRTLVQVGAFFVPWVVAAWLLGAYPRNEPPRPGAFLGRSLNAWLVAAPLGMVLRALLLDRATIPVPFFLVTLGVGGAFLLGWRAIFTVVQRSIVRRQSI